jgi:hypothetical protein
MMFIISRIRYFTHSVVDDQPTVPGQDWGSTATDFKPFPGRYGGGKPVMRIKKAYMISMSTTRNLDWRTVSSGRVP